MTVLVGDIAYRFYTLLLFGFAPFTIAPDVRPPASGLATCAHCLVAALVLVVLAAAAMWIRRRSRVAATALASALGTALAAAIAFRGSSGPMARAALVQMLLGWVAAATVVYAIMVRSPTRRGNALALIAALVASAASGASAWSRIRSRAAMWTAALASDAGDEPAALAVAAILDRGGRPADAAGVLTRCALANPGACRCVLGAGQRWIAVGRFGEAVRALEGGASACADENGFAGTRADALVRTGQTLLGLQLAEATLARNLTDSHALFAKAAAQFAQGRAELALTSARMAQEAGYGEDAALLAGSIDITAGRLDAAERELKAARARAPRNPRLTYDLALIADRQGRFHDAREGYLAALQLDPTFADARYNLAMLTSRVGAMDEARHSVEELARIAPSDPRLPSVRRAVGLPASD